MTRLNDGLVVLARVYGSYPALRVNSSSDTEVAMSLSLLSVLLSADRLSAVLQACPDIADIACSDISEEMAGVLPSGSDGIR